MNNLRELVASWDKDSISVSQLLGGVRDHFPDASHSEVRAAVESVARGAFSPASSCAAAALCSLLGYGDPLKTAERIFGSANLQPTEPQWFLWIAGYSFHWICNSGLRCCYFEFDDRHFADRIRVYEAIGAETAAEVLRDADSVFGPNGPADTLEGRQAQISDELYQGLRERSPRFWNCGDEIFTRSFLYALEHPTDFRDGGRAPTGESS